MKHLLFIFALFLGFTVQSQSSNFKKASLTKTNGEVQDVFYKVRSYLVDGKGELNIYSSPNNSDKLNISASNLSKIESHNRNIIIVSVLVNNIDNNKPVLLRKLVDGEHVLYEYTSSLGEKTFVDGFNGDFLKLDKNAENKDGTFYKKWLFENLNPQKKNTSNYISLNYNQKELKKYYTENQSNTSLLAQEEKVKALNFGIHAGIIFNKFTGPLYTIEEGSPINYKVGIQGLLNIDRVKNNHTLFGGFTYYTELNGDGVSAANPKSQIQRIEVDTKTKFNFWAFHFGYQYNINLNKISFSPFLSFEQMFFISNNIVNVTSREDQGIVYYTEAFRDTSKSINIGIRIATPQNIFVILEYGKFLKTEPIGSVINRGIEDSSIDISRFSVSLGYKFL